MIQFIQFHDVWPKAKRLALQLLIEKASAEKQIIGQAAELSNDKPPTYMRNKRLKKPTDFVWL